MSLFLKTLFFFLLVTQLCLAQWMQTNFPSNASVLCLAASETYLYAGMWGQDIYQSNDDGDNWFLVGTRLPCSTVRAITFSGANVIAGIGGEPCRDPGGICLSTDNGRGWSQVLDGRVGAPLASNDNKVFAECNGMWFSSDYGMTWDSVNNGLPISTIQALLVSDANTFAGSEGDGVFLTTNDGISWAAVNNGLSNLFVNDLAISNNHIFAGTSDGIFLTIDDGANWSSAATGLPTGSYITDFAVIDTNIFTCIGYYIGNDHKSAVYLSTNFGGTWSDVGSGLPLDIYVSSLAIKGDYIFAAGQNVWRRSLLEMVTGINEISNRLPQDFILDQNYPNPFNPSTKINYTVPQMSQVQIKVVDVLGNEIETLVNEEKPAGTYELTWNAVNLPSGVYFYQLKSGSFVDTKKMLLLK